MSNNIDHMVTQVRDMFKGIPGVEVDFVKLPVSWNGEGLPPVGCECELFDSESGWEVVFVKFVGNKTVVVDLLDGDKYFFELSTCEFRPLRTEAERKREEAIAALKQLKPQLVGELAGYLYDEIAAGKIPHITLK
ncbi:hypothetical protein [Mixta calida]|uniref:hypothetical protein n=1 Tax=Mixta calida TaxID=665913 RepID=UPI00289D9F2D|nr:hypothetical protein [Mixta calida]